MSFYHNCICAECYQYLHYGAINRSAAFLLATAHAYKILYNISQNVHKELGFNINEDLPKSISKPTKDLPKPTPKFIRKLPLISLK